MKPPGISNKQFAVLCEARDLSNYLGIPMPDIYFDKQEDERGRHLTRRFLGECYSLENQIMIKLRMQTISALRSTLTHEFVHLAFSIEHGIRFEQYIKFLSSRSLFFDGRGLVTEFPKPRPDKSQVLTELEAKLRKTDSKIKRFNTYRKKLLRKIKRLES